MTFVKANEPWLETAPRGWPSSRIRNIAQLSPSYSDGPPEPNELCAVVPMELLSEAGTVDTSSIQSFKDVTGGLTLFEAGDVLFAKITPCMENGKGAFVDSLPTRYAFGSTEFHVLRPYHFIHPKFLYYYTFNPIFRDYAAENMSGAAGQKRVSSRFLKDTRLFLPPLSEQERIAAYLDASCAAIDAAVSAKRRQLETLDALRNFTVHRAVTQGLNASVKLKAAELDWLSDVPAHWRASRIRNVAKLSPGYSGKPPTADEQCTVVPMELLSNDGRIDTTSVQPPEDVTGGLTLFETGDVLFAKITPCMENGKGAFVESLSTRYAFGSTEFHVLRPFPAVDGRFLYFYTFNPVFRAYAAQNMSGAAGQKRVSSCFLKDTRLFLPPLPEQRAISAFLTKKDVEFRTLFAQLENQIATLTAYRKSLIHECVTGQRRITEADVRRAEMGAETNLTAIHQ